MTERKRMFLTQELQKLPVLEINGNRAAVICPFHNDSNPSGTINLDPYGERAPLGWFRCWSCGTSVYWDKYAAVVGLRPMDETRKTEDDYVDPRKSKESLHDEDEELSYEEELESLEFSDFPEDEWRSIPTKVLAKLGCRYVYVPSKSKNYIWFPVLIFGELKGYVKGELEKSDDPKVLSYINAPGKWAQKYGLLYFDFALRMMKKKGLKTLVISEGPRDSIRQLRYGIPAVSVLGALNFGEDKRFLLERAGVENLILFMDGDEAGRTATKRIYRLVREHFNTKFLRLWKSEPGKDPFNCSKQSLRLVKESLK